VPTVPPLPVFAPPSTIITYGPVAGRVVTTSIGDVMPSRAFTPSVTCMISVARVPLPLRHGGIVALAFVSQRAVFVVASLDAASDSVTPSKLRNSLRPFAQAGAASGCICMLASMLLPLPLPFASVVPLPLPGLKLASQPASRAARASSFTIPIMTLAKLTARILVG